ncbi:MAG: DUF2190 family protein [Ignavibacteriaceae bacterium]|nr:DUF2190 family protein [Ignavibacteriaceae bacterium]
MLTEQPILITSIKCNQTGGVVKNRFISFTGAYGATGTKSLGVANADTNLEEMIPVTAKGIAIVEAADAISLGRPVQICKHGTAVTQDAGPLKVMRWMKQYLQVI